MNGSRDEEGTAMVAGKGAGVGFRSNMGYLSAHLVHAASQ